MLCLKLHQQPDLDPFIATVNPSLSADSSPVPPCSQLKQLEAASSPSGGDLLRRGRMPHCPWDTASQCPGRIRLTRPNTALCDHGAGVLLHISIAGWLPRLSDRTKAWSKFCIQAPRNVWHSSCWSAWKEGLFIYLLSKEKLPLGLKRLTLPLPSGWRSLNGTSQFYCSQYDIYKLPPDAFALTTVAMTVHCSKTQWNK